MGITPCCSQVLERTQIMVHECSNTPDKPGKPDKPVSPAKPLSHPEQVLKIAVDELLNVLMKSAATPSLEAASYQGESYQEEIDGAIRLILKATPDQPDYTGLNSDIQAKVRSLAQYIVLFQRTDTTAYSSLVSNLQAFLRELVGFHDLKLKGLTGSNPLYVSQWAVQGPSLRRSISAKKRIFLNSLSSYQ